MMQFVSVCLVFLINAVSAGTPQHPPLVENDDKSDDNPFYLLDNPKSMLEARWSEEKKSEGSGKQEPARTVEKPPPLPPSQEHSFEKRPQTASGPQSFQENTKSYEGLSTSQKAAHFLRLTKVPEMRVKMEKDPQMPDMLGELLEELKQEPKMYNAFVKQPSLHNLMQIRENKLFIKEMSALKSKAMKAQGHKKNTFMSELEKIRKEQFDVKDHLNTQRIRGKWGTRRAIDINPTMIVLIVAVVMVVLMFAVFALKEKSPTEKSLYQAFTQGSGLSTSSSDVTSSETGSTDKELKCRMERFEQRLEYHRKKMEDEGTLAERLSTGSTTDDSLSSENRKPLWMRKR